MTLLERVIAGELPDAVRIVAEDEGVDPELLRQRVAAGRVVIPQNERRSFHPRGIGAGLRTKVNANIGTSGHHACLEEELEKLRVSVEAGADSVMDLSTGGELARIRAALLERSPLMLGTVPLYALAARLEAQGRALLEMTEDEIFETIEAQCASGVDYITVHCGATRRALAALSSQERALGIVSRGGSITAAWMTAHGRENPLYASFDRLLELCHAHDVTLSLGDSLRPGSVVDATDRGQIEELITLGELARRARGQGVQAMIEGPGHVPLHQIAAHVELQKRLCEGAPFYVLGPLTTDLGGGPRPHRRGHRGRRGCRRRGRLFVLRHAGRAPQAAGPGRGARGCDRRPHRRALRRHRQGRARRAGAGPRHERAPRPAGLAGDAGRGHRSRARTGEA